MSGCVSEVQSIFHPRKSRAPSIVLSDDHQRRGSLATQGQPPHDPTDSFIRASSDVVELRHMFLHNQWTSTFGYELQGSHVPPECSDSASSSKSVDTSHRIISSGTGVGDGGGSQNYAQGPNPTSRYFGSTSVTCRTRSCSILACYTSCCAESARKIYFGICVTICVTASWVGATHSIKYLYFQKPQTIISHLPVTNISISGTQHEKLTIPYNAPFFTTWFCTNWAVLYFPLYFICRVARTKCSNPSEIVAESFRGFRDKGFTGARFLTRCSFFCGLWVATNYMYIHSLRILLATDVMALFATNVACVYLLSWVILHEQFVGVRIVAVILCDTGIALLAYMDGITGSPTLGGVVLAASAAAGSAVYKVLFKKVIGETTFGQVALFFTLIGMCNAALLWPVCIALYFSGAESIYWEKIPWAPLLSASVLHLVANLLGNFSVALTYDLFITLGLITAVPVSAALDVVLYGTHFVGMKLAGMILIAIGFFLVMFPDNWPDYIIRLLRWSRRHRHGLPGGSSRDVIDYRTGYIKSHLRSPSGRVR